MEESKFKDHELGHVHDKNKSKVIKHQSQPPDIWDPLLEEQSPTCVHEEGKKEQHNVNLQEAVNGFTSQIQSYLK
jgi:hypothetical protein